MKFLTGILSLLLLPSCASFTGSRSCQIQELKLADADFKVSVSRYAGQIKSGKSILILPPTGGTNYIDRSYAEKFCAAGFDVYILNNWTGLSEISAIDPELHQRLYSRAQKAIALALTEVKSPFIGLLGTSLGALHASVAASLQDKVNAVFIIVGGAPISEIIVTSDQQGMIDLREARKKKYGFKNISENQKAIEEVFHLEPMQLGDRYKNKDLGMALATQDSVVPYLNQNKLLDYWKPKKVLSYTNGHFWGIVKTWLFASDEVLDFFEESSKKF